LYKIGIIGLGYVGLPLAIAFNKHYAVTGFDINHNRVEQLQCGNDVTNEVSLDELKSAHNINFTSKIADLVSCNIYIVTVPTPVLDDNTPDLKPISEASKRIGEILKVNDLIIFESTVYPGTTEEVCVPILEEASGKKLNLDFYVGYSPERINPGDKERSISDIVKLTSGSTPEIANKVDQLYKKIIGAGTFLCSCIKVAEAAKVIENTQRDINIAFANECSQIFDRIGIDTNEVIQAAGTKWNFNKFTPGLVGGHCISVDPYYLQFKAQKLGYEPRLLSAARQINDGVAHYAVSKFITYMIGKDIAVDGSSVLVLGATFKGNCPDTRNTQVSGIVYELTNKRVIVDLVDPLANPEDFFNEYGYQLLSDIPARKYDGIIVAVEHDYFKEMSREQIMKLCKANNVISDLKSIWPKDWSDHRL